MCRNGTLVSPVRRKVDYANADAIVSVCTKQIPKNYIWYLLYGILRFDNVRVVVSGTLFDRKLEKAARSTLGVRTIAFPKTTRLFRGGAFRGIKTLRAALFPDIETLSVSALRGESEACMGVFEYSGLARVRLPNTLRTIDKQVFQFCSELRRIELPEGLQKIGEKAFFGSGLTRLDVPASVTELGTSTFSRCTSLEVVNFPDNSRLEKIDSDCLKETAIREIELPHSLKIVGRRAFGNCKQLDTVYIEGARMPNDVDPFGSSVLIGYPKRFKVGDALLWDLRGLKSVVIPDGIEKIGWRWFTRSEIRSVSFPASVRVIEEKAF